jgi:glycogen debranching enzyme
MAEPWTLTEEAEPVPAATVTLVQGASFAICDRAGDIGGRGVEGLFVGDTRVCSRLVVTVDGARAEPLAVAPLSPFAASFVGRTVDRSLLVFRDAWVGRGMRADLCLRNLTDDDRRVVVRVELDGDLADLFAVKEGRSVPAPVSRRAQGGTVAIVGDDGRRGMVARSPGAVASPDCSLRWDAHVPARSEWVACVELAAVRGGEEVEPRHRCAGPPQESVPASAHTGWERRLPRLVTDVAGLGAAFDRAVEDLGALRIVDPDHPDDPAIAAGAPWYMTLFGRDSILTSWMALLIEPRLALGVVRTLARLQGRRHVPETEEQPGRILHEVRFARGPSLALSQGDVYFGTVDATPLFVMLVHELWRWGVTLDELASVLPAVDAALDWMAGPGDPDGDGYLEYARSAPGGLVNQGWKDSHDGVSFADGRIAEPPIALAEAQAYAYAAWRAGAALAAATGDRVIGDRRAERAEKLQAQFDRDFWMPDRAAFALALDGDKRPVDTVASNMGHCLWAGIVADPDKASAVARWLTSPEFASGWGVRTLATSMGRYNPLSYHNGSVWPHDTAICIAGLRRAGFVDEALELTSALLAAAEASDGRLPELFAGLTDQEMPVPVPYPASCSPQAWASAAPLLVTRALLGLEPDVPAGVLNLDPVLPRGAHSLRIADVPLAESLVTIGVEEDAVALRGIPRGLAMIRRPEPAADRRPPPGRR